MVLEHHSGVDLDDRAGDGAARWWRRLASENWDAPALRRQAGLTGPGSHRSSYGGFGGGHPHFHPHTLPETSLDAEANGRETKLHQGIIRLGWTFRRAVPACIVW